MDMKLDNRYEADFIIEAFGTSEIGKAKIIYDVYFNGQDYKDDLIIKDVEIGNAGSAHSISKNELSDIIEANIKNLMMEYGSFTFDNKIVTISFDVDQIQLITELKENGNDLNDNIDDFIIDDIDVKDKDNIGIDF